jgi:hypothetical protein
MPPTIHSINKGNIDRISINWNPKLVKTPVPIMDATIKERAVQKEIWRPALLVFKDQYLNKFRDNKNQPSIKHMPPMGVIAPNHLIFVRTKIYRLPENINVPEKRRYAGVFSKSWGRW